MLRDPEVLQALAAGLVVAVLCGVLGVFVVLRRGSFAAHAVTDLGLTGGAGASLAGAPPLAGLLLASVFGSAVIARLGVRARESDVATGTVLTAALGVGALFLFVQTRAGVAPTALLFGSIFAVRPEVLVTSAVLGGASLLALAALFRPLAFSTVSPEAAASRGVPVAFVGTAFLVLMAVALAEAAQLVGVLLTTALVIGPASAAIVLSSRLATALVLAVVFGVAQMTLSVVLAYASYTWPPGGTGWPVSFFVGVLALVSYVAARALARGRGAC
ncbi:MAG TPA: metal ABC transporter permease [Candidatus Limnocylindria bacterium]|nr:metal ABC transporter permease [Candidatus Limnocylindria bacterium]